MPDFAMCKGERKDGDDLFVCKKREDCFRYKSTPDEFRQSYFGEAPFNRETNECSHFWQITRKPA
jgi:hypothetical protein